MQRPVPARAKLVPAEHGLEPEGDGWWFAVNAAAAVWRRSEESSGILYPVSEAAARQGASVVVPTPDPREAYAGGTPRVAIPARRDVLPGAPR